MRLICSGRPHNNLRSPLNGREARSFASSGGLHVFCATCQRSGECCGKEASAEVSPTVRGAFQASLGCAAQVEDMQVPRLFLHDVDFGVGSYPAPPPS